MIHQTLYRKYRPSNFAEVKGQSQVVALFEQVISQEKLAHAYLFVGGRGTGKTSVARIVAKELGTDPADLYEIDGASNRGIDEIRILRDGVSTVPFASKYKVYIIDEAHMLTVQACNALLKTLEEPPAHCIFILATTDPEKLPATIRSRCQVIEFKKPDTQTLVTLLLDVAQVEKVALEQDAAEAIAELGDGSYRDTLTIFERSIALSQNKTIDKRLIDTLFTTPDRSLAVKLLEQIVAGDSSGALETLQILSESQSNSKQLLHILIDCARIALVSRFDTKHAYIHINKKIYSQEELEKLYACGANKARPLTAETLIQLISIDTMMAQNSTQDRALLEAAVLSLLETK